MRGARGAAEAKESVTHFLRRALFSTVFLTGAMLARAGVSYDESPVFAFDTRDYTIGLAAESAVFAFDTRLVDGLQGAAVSASFAFDTRGATLPPLQITGVLRDSAGVPVVGATIQIKRAGAIFWQGVSGAGGTFSTPNLSGVNYTVIVTKTGYVTSITNIAGTAGGSLALNLQSAALPAALATQDVFRGLAPGALGTIGPGAFQVFDGTNFVHVLIHPPDPTRDTLVLTHGWKSNPDVWAKQMAKLVHDRPGLQTLNIVTWDWHAEAAGATPTIDKAMPQGLLLGSELQLWLGTGYNHHIHFIGHSLGTIVNKYACDYTHHMLDRGNPASFWDKETTQPHITLLDDAETASVGGLNVPWNSAQSWLAANSFGLISPPADTSEPYLKSPIPRSAKWIDNYISAVGLRHSEAVNVWLLQPLSNSTVISLTTFRDSAHSYAWQWYTSTISPTGTPPTVGFNSSKWIAPVFPPTSPVNGTLLFENLATADPVDLTSDPSVVYALGLSPDLASIPAASVLPVAIGNTGATIGQKVLTGYQTSVKWVDKTSTAIVQKVGDVSVDVGQKIGLAWDAAIDFERDVLNSVNQDLQVVNPLTAPVLKMILRSKPAQSPFAATTAQAIETRAPTAASSTAGQPAYAWITVAVPSDAGMMAFDFTVTGDPVDDKIACAINDQNVFTLSAKFAPNGTPASTDMIDVSAYAGQNIELFFGLAGGTSTNCELAIDGLRFITVPTPKVAVGVAAGTASVKWPAAASNWTLESSETLAQGSWQPVPLATGLTLDSGVATLQEAVSLPKKFYRLRRNP